MKFWKGVLVVAALLGAGIAGLAIWSVVDHFEDQHQVERRSLDRTDVGQLAAQPVVLALLAHLDRLRCDVVAEELAVGRHAELQLAEHLSGTAADLANRLR